MDAQLFIGRGDKIMHRPNTNIGVSITFLEQNKAAVT